jgi:small subunit ribosomal protein S16
MIKIRLKRFGKKREASYRLVAVQSTSRRDGRPLEELGFYNPRTDEVRLETDAIVKRLQQGAQPTDTVRRILEKANVMEQKPRAIQQAAPAIQETAPAIQETAPAIQETVPVIQETAPAIEKSGT